MLAIALFFLNGIIGNLLSKYSFFDYEPLLYSDPNSNTEHNGIVNFSIKVVHPIIFMAIVATIIQGVLQSDALPWIKSLWLIDPFYWGVQYAYAKFRNRTRFHVKHVEEFNFYLSFIFYIVVYLLVVLLATEENEFSFPSIFISLDALRDALWYAIIAFVIKDIWEIFKFRYSQSREIVNERIETVLTERYDELSNKYGYEVEECIRKVFHDSIHDAELEKHIYYLIFAIMIYEDYNRSENVRKVENFFHKIFRGTMSMGIMQVQSTKEITDKESIENACELLKPRICEEVQLICQDTPYPLGSINTAVRFDGKIREILRVYNGKKLYAEEVSNLFYSIQNWENKRMPVFS